MSFAQITISSNANAFKIGDTHEFILTSFSDEGPSGEKVIWDFTGLKPNGKNLVSKMLGVNTSDKSNLFPDANLILEEFGNQFFFKVNNEGMEQYGIVSACDVVTNFEQPLLKLKFPFKYGDRAISNYSGAKSSSNANSSTAGTCEIVADAYGTLLLPNNISIENAIRVSQTRTFENSNQSEITYRWYAKGIRYPILTIIKYVSPEKSFIAQTALYAHTSETGTGQIISSIEDFNTSKEVTMFPNPFKDGFTINYTLDNASKVSIDVYDISGKLVKTIFNSPKQEKGTYNFSINSAENNLLQGVYYIRISMGNKCVTRKMIQLQ